MIHYTCDRCKRTINPQEELRYSVRVEVCASPDPSIDELDSDRDHLQEIEDILERIDVEHVDEMLGGACHYAQFDLCEACRRQFIRNPLGYPTGHELNFSQN